MGTLVVRSASGLRPAWALASRCREKQTQPSPQRWVRSHYRTNRTALLLHDDKLDFMSLEGDGFHCLSSQCKRQNGLAKRVLTMTATQTSPHSPCPLSEGSDFLPWACCSHLQTGRWWGWDSSPRYTLDFCQSSSATSEWLIEGRVFTQDLGLHRENQTVSSLTPHRWDRLLKGRMNPERCENEYFYNMCHPSQKYMLLYSP